MEISEQLARDTVMVCKAYRKGVEIAKKPTFGKKKKQLNDLLNDLNYLINSYESILGEEVKFEKDL